MADGVTGEAAFVRRTGFHQFARKIHVGGKKHVERRALPDLREEVAGGTGSHLHRRPWMDGLEFGVQLIEGKDQIGGGSHRDGPCGGRGGIHRRSRPAECRNRDHPKRQRQRAPPCLAHRKETHVAAIASD